MKMDALIISVDEPQLTRCLESVKRQTIPFSNVIHINGVVPECDAFNAGIQQVSSEWVMLIGGDFILYDNAVRKARKYIRRDRSEKIASYYFGLNDTFLGRKIGFCAVAKSDVYKKFLHKDRMSYDGYIVSHLRKLGYEIRTLYRMALGTHFDSPDEFQVFRRCYCHGIRAANNKDMIARLTAGLSGDDHRLYQLGLDAIRFAKYKKTYPGSHNVDFEKEMFVEFTEWRMSNV